MKVRELMHTPVVTCGAETTLVQAGRAMADAAVGTIVTVSAEGHPMGIITDRDLAVKGYGRDLPGWTTVGRIMTHAVFTAPADADVHEAVKVMGAHGVRRLPVVDGDGALVGVVAFDDILVHLAHEADELARAVVAQTDTGHYGGWSGWDEG